MSSLIAVGPRCGGHRPLRLVGSEPPSRGRGGVVPRSRPFERRASWRARRSVLPASVDGLDEQGVPAVEQLRAEGLELVDLLVRRKDETAVTGLAEQDLAPVVDELREVDRPVHLGHLSEDGSEQIVEDDLTVEADDQVVDLASTVEVSPRSTPLLNGHDHQTRGASLGPGGSGCGIVVTRSRGWLPSRPVGTCSITFSMIFLVFARTLGLGSAHGGLRSRSRAVNSAPPWVNSMNATSATRRLADRVVQRRAHTAVLDIGPRR